MLVFIVIGRLVMKLFHIHTHRCGHASDESDEQYILNAICMDASDIYFTDHAPFPDNPFGNRMDINQLDEYISSLCKLKHSYEADINVHIGLEIEFLPSYVTYYEKLHSIREIEILMIGQHFFEISPKRYSFSIKQTPLNHAEGICDATVEGISTGLFSYVAHPDRMFRYCQSWNSKMYDIAENVVTSAQKRNIILEKNLSSMENGMYWSQFWECVPDVVRTIYGIDAHSVKDFDRINSML